MYYKSQLRLGDNFNKNIASIHEKPIHAYTHLFKNLLKRKTSHQMKLTKHILGENSLNILVNSDPYQS